jgi:MFS family permease
LERNLEHRESCSLQVSRSSLLVSLSDLCEYNAETWPAICSLTFLCFSVWAPASEVWGRRDIFIISYLFLTLWQAVTCASQNIQTVLVLRFLAGLFGSSPLANAGGTISDVLDANSRGLGMAIFAAAPFLGPSLGPLTGGFLGLTAGWRWVMGFLAIFTGVISVVLFLFSAETYAPYLLRQRATTLSKATGMVYRFRADAKRPFQIGPLFKSSLIRPWKFLLFEVSLAI